VSAVLPSWRIREFLEALAARPRRRLWLVGALAAALLLLLPLLSVWSSRSAGDVVVRRGTLAPAVPLVGTLLAERSDSYGATVPGVELKVLWLVAEGSLVAAGDRIIQFDPAPFEKERETAAGRVRELEAETDQARLAVEALRLRSEGSLEEAEMAAATSERELTAFVNSAAPLLASESAHDVELKRRQLQEAEEKLTGLEPFVAPGFISQEEFRAAQSRRDQAAADLRIAEARHSALVRQTNPDLVARKQEEASGGKRQLDLSRQRSRIELQGAEAALRLASVRLDQARRQVEDAQKKISACAVVASGPGLAVHSEVYDKAGERRKVRTGDSVWGGTTLVTLPDLSKMLVEGRVAESEIQHLSEGEAVRVRLDAFPELALTGVLRAIGSVGSAEKNESRSFPVRIALNQSNGRFRPGMLARCVVVGRAVPGALIVPIDAVRTDARGTFVRVRSILGRVSRRPIVTGRSTAQMVEVRQGLREGEVVRIGEE
jgi:HlyD family secretion protein